MEGIFCRYEDAEGQLERISTFSRDIATREMQDIYAEPIKPELIAERIKEIKAQGVVAAASLTPQKVRKYYEVALEAGLDILVIQGTVVSAEHVSRDEQTPAQPQGIHPRACAHAGGRRRLAPTTPGCT